jgi:cellulose biosynthesis protein BcsQ
MGIVPMKYRSSTVLHKRNLESLRKQFGNKVWKPLALRTIWGEASLMRRPVFNLAPDSKAASEVWQMVSRIEESLA